jgi:hypothetical protein
MSNLPRRITRFKGLNNVSDGIRLKNGWMSKADNINITDTGGIVRREGYSPVIAGSIKGCYTTEDFKRMYLALNGGIHLVNGNDFTTSELLGGMALGEIRWAETNHQVYFTDGVNSGVITPSEEVISWGWEPPTPISLTAIDGNLPAGDYRVACTFILPDGRETGASNIEHITVSEGKAILVEGIELRQGYDTLVYVAPADSTVFQLAFKADAPSMVWGGNPDQLGVEATTLFLDPLPGDAKFPTFWRGRVYVSEFIPSQNVSIVWFSEPLGYHLFDLSKNFILVPGEVVMLAPSPDALILGTLGSVYSYNEDTFTTEASYGVVPGWSWAKDEDNKILFWTCRGLCSALPFSNLTLRQISVRPGSRVGATIIHKDGYKRFLACLHKGGEIFNPRN